MDAVMVGDLFRFLNFIAGAVVIGLTVWIAANYGLAYWRAEQKWQGLLPRHVATIAVSYLILVVVVLYEHTGNEEPFGWRDPVDLIALSCGAWALRDMTRFQRYRKVRLPGEGSRRRRPKRR